MKIFVDARWTRIGSPDGITRYGAGLIAALHERHPVTMIIHDERQLASLPSGVPHVRLNNPISLRELTVARRLNRLGADVVFSPMQVIGSFGRRFRLVLTLHDLIYYRHPTPPGFLPLPVRLLWRAYHTCYWPQRVLLNRADAVVAVSETTAELIREHRLTRRPITVVPNAGPDAAEQPPAPSPAPQGAPSGDETSLPAKDIVYIGSFMPYKNVETLIAGTALLPGYRLHLLSPIAPEREAELTAGLPPGAGVVFWRGVSEDRYRAFLGSAAALVTASRDEGFGLPVIEAMTAGTPVVCSDLPVFREITDGHAEFFDPDSPAEFAARVRALDDPVHRRSLVDAARRQAAEYTWPRSADRLLALLTSLGRRGNGGDRTD